MIGKINWFRALSRLDCLIRWNNLVIFCLKINSIGIKLKFYKNGLVEHQKERRIFAISGHDTVKHIMLITSSKEST